MRSVQTLEVSHRDKGSQGGSPDSRRQASRLSSVAWNGFYKNRSKMGPSFRTVASGHSLRSVVMAASKAQCSGHLGSFGIRGITSIKTRFAVSAFTVRWPKTVWAETG